MNFNGYGLFNDVRKPVLQAYNRANTYLNINERHGKEVGMRYLRKFDRNGQLAIFSIMKRIHVSGYEQTRRDIMRVNNG